MACFPLRLLRESSPVRLAIRSLALAFGLLAYVAADAAVAAELDDFVGAPQRYVTRAEDTFVDIARYFDVGYVELVAANRGVDPWLPGRGVVISLPTEHLLPVAPHRGIVINLAELRLYYFPPGGAPVLTFPIGIGSEGDETKLGTTRVAAKRPNPTWIPPPSIRAERPELPGAIPPGPDNPLGAFALNLAWRHYVIHGTNKPYGVGRRVSHGCIRLYPEDIAHLYALVPVGTPVTVLDDPVKLGWRGGALYLEVHPDQRQSDELEERGELTPHPIDGLAERILKEAGKEAGRLNWLTVTLAELRRTGLPMRIMD